MNIAPALLIVYCLLAVFFVYVGVLLWHSLRYTMRRR